MSSSSGTPGESTASRIDRIGRQHRRSENSDQENEPQENPIGEENADVENLEEFALDEDAVVSSSMQGDPDASEDAPAEDLDDPEQDLAEEQEVRNSSVGSFPRGGEPSNFAPWYQRSKQQAGDGAATATGGPSHNIRLLDRGLFEANVANDVMVSGMASALERIGIVDAMSNALTIDNSSNVLGSSGGLITSNCVSRAGSQPPPINNPNMAQPASATGESPNTRRNTFQNAFQNEPGGSRNSGNFEAALNGAIGFYNWQATKMTVKERISFLFNSSILSDVTFIVGRDSQQQRIPAHKFVLSVGSAVFDAMFNSTLATSDEEIPLPDVEPASFLALLKFLYSDEVQIGPETVMTTLYTAKKYAVPALEKHCVDFLKKNLCADNAFMLLTQARLFDEPQLAALCLETIDKNTPEALSAEGFTDIDINTLCAVLDRDSLRIKEAKLFAAVIKWSEAECVRQNLNVTPENKRGVLGTVLGKIRFPLMTVEEFAQGPAQSGILTDRECVSLFLHFTVNPKPPVGFLDVPRCSMTGKEQTVCRFTQIESRWGYSGTSDKIRFIVDKKIFVVGFGLYGSIHGPCEYQVNIQIIHTGSGRLLGSNEIAFSSDGTNSTFRVMFKEPIEIQPNTNYTASATLKGLDSHYGTKGMRKVAVECPGGTKVVFQFSYAAGNNNGTSVEDGQIPELIFYT